MASLAYCSTQACWPEPASAHCYHPTGWGDKRARPPLPVACSDAPGPLPFHRKLTKTCIAHLPALGPFSCAGTLAGRVRCVVVLCVRLAGDRVVEPGARVQERGHGIEERRLFGLYK